MQAVITKTSNVGSQKTVAPAKDSLIILLLHSKWYVKYSMLRLPSNEDPKKPF